MGVRLLVFTDLDGTLLDHATYSHDAAAPALRALADCGVPLVLASSKTAAEMVPLHAALALGDAPMIVENGAGQVWPGQGRVDAADYARLRAALDAVPAELRHRFRGFGDMDTAGVAQVTGLSPDAAALARKRQFSEPGLWDGDAAQEQAFVAALGQAGVTARRGGRFLTLSFGRTKADAMREIAARLGAEFTVALGDAPNDAEMLAAADQGVLVRNDHAPEIPGLAPGIRRTERPGPEGWNTAVLEILQDRGLLERR